MADLNISLKQFAIEEGIEEEVDTSVLGAFGSLSGISIGASGASLSYAANASSWALVNNTPQVTKYAMDELEADKAEIKNLEVEDSFMLNGGGSIAGAALYDSIFYSNATFDYSSNVFFNGVVKFDGSVHLSNMTMLSDGNELNWVIDDLRQRITQLENANP